MSVTLLEMLERRAKANELTKAEFGRIMHDESSTEDDIERALNMMEEAGGYENLPE